MSFDHLSPLDAGFLDLENNVNQMHIGSVLILEGPPPSFCRFRAMVAGKLAEVPRYRQVTCRVAFDLARPVWVDDPDFDLDYHLRRVAVPRPGGARELRELVGDLMGRPLDRSRPLWELWVAEDLEGDQWAVVAKVHHCMVDGIGGVELLRLILDLQRDAEPVPPGEWRPDPLPSPKELLAQTVAQTASGTRQVARTMLDATGTAGDTVRQVGEAARQIGQLARGIPGLAKVIKPTPAGSLNGPIGPHRRWAATSVPISDIKVVRSSLGGAFNDVAMAAVTRGFRTLLETRGETLDRSIRTLVPVSVRGRDASGRAVGDGTLANKVSAVLARLPVETADPVERLRAISTQMTSAKEGGEAGTAQGLMSLTRFIPPTLATLGSHMMAKAPQRNVNTITTNIPGPQFPLYAAGRRMLRAYPYVPIGLQVRIGVAILSYDGELNFGITGDYDHASDVDVIAEGIRVGVDEMLAATASTSSHVN
jgi:diacylglycerol O-acyltransferase / wax synthase